MSIPKTKGSESLGEEDVAQIGVVTGKIEMVEHFTYLG